MSLRDRALKGTLWSTLEVWGGRVLNFVVFLLLARLLKPEAFGLVAMAGVYIAFLRVFVDQGFAAAIVQRDDLEGEHLDTAFWANLGFGVLLTGGSIVAAGLVAQLYGEAELTSVIRWLALSLIISGLGGVQGAIFQRNLDFRVLSIRTLIANIVGGGTGIAMALMDYGVWSLVGKQLVGGALGMALLWQLSDWRPGLKVSRRHFMDLFSFGVNILGANILNFLNRRADDLLIGIFLGSTALGYYSVAYNLIRTFTGMLSSVSSRVAFPVFSKMQKEPERMRNAFYKVTRFTSFLSFPAFLGLAALAPQIVEVAFGAKWLPSAPVMRILAFIGILHSVFYFNTSVMMAVGKPQWRLINMVVNATSNIIAFYIAVRWGIVAVAAAYVIRGYAVSSPLTIWIVRKLIGIDVTRYLQQFSVPFVGSLVMVLVVIAMTHALQGQAPAVVLLASYVLTGATVYGIAIWLFAPSLPGQAFSLSRSVIGRGN